MIHFAHPTQTDLLKKIWQSCFDDNKYYIDSYYFHRSNKVRTLIAEQQGIPISMLDMISIDIKLKNQLYTGIYIYAAATLPQYQGQGWMHKLIHTCCEIASQEGAGFIVLVPQTPSLVKFYQQLGFHEKIYLNECVTVLTNLNTTQNHSPIRMCSEEEFIELKQNYEQRFSNVVLHDKQLNSLIYRQILAGGGSVLLNTDLSAYAICWPEKGQLNIQEISIWDDTQSIAQFASDCCQYYHQPQLKLRQIGNNVLYGLGKPLQGNLLPLNDVYMNTMLD